MIYLYGLAEAQEDHMRNFLDGLDGLQGPLQVAQAGEWVLPYSAHDDAELLPKRRPMLKHTRVVEQMMTAGPVLPARFGLVAQSLSEAQQLVSNRRSIIADAFDRIRGSVEMGVRVRFPRASALAATLSENPDLQSQRDALNGMGAEAHFAVAEFGGKLADRLDRRRARAQATLLAALRPLAKDHVLRTPDDDVEVLRAEFLIASDTQSHFEAAVEDVCTTLDFAPGEEPQIQLVGPVPAYNFVRLSLADDPDEAAA